MQHATRQTVSSCNLKQRRANRRLLLPCSYVARLVRRAFARSRLPSAGFMGGRVESAASRGLTGRTSAAHVPTRVNDDHSGHKRALNLLYPGVVTVDSALS